MLRGQIAPRRLARRPAFKADIVRGALGPAINRAIRPDISDAPDRPLAQRESEIGAVGVGLPAVLPLACAACRRRLEIAIPDEISGAADRPIGERNDIT